MQKRIDGVDLTFEVVGEETRITTKPRLALTGRLVVRRPNLLDRFLRLFRRPFFADAALERKLVVRRSSEAIARALLDEEVQAKLLSLELIELRYNHDAIVLRFRGAGLEEALACAAYLAAGMTKTAYR